MLFTDLKEIRERRPLIAAHRGAIGVNVPCNSLEAFEVALRQGADIIEIDITKSLDGELFVFHPFMDFPHLGKIIPMQFKHSSFIKKFRYRNVDFVKTEYKISTLDEVLDCLKGRCVINVDKFWCYPKKIIETLKRHDMLEDVLVKSYYNEDTLRVLSELAPAVPYMLMLRKYSDNIEEKVKAKGVRLVAEELIFKTINDELISDERIERLHNDGIYAWANSIVYNYKDVIAADKTDDRAVTCNLDDTWGWLRDKCFDIIQTDWVRELSLFLNR